MSRHHLLAKHPTVAFWESEGPKPFLFPPVVFVAKVVSRSGEKQKSPASARPLTKLFAKDGKEKGRQSSRTLVNTA